MTTNTCVCYPRKTSKALPFQRPARPYGLNYGGHVGDGQVVFTVGLSPLLEALDVLRGHPEPEDE